MVGWGGVRGSIILYICVSLNFMYSLFVINSSLKSLKCALFFIIYFIDGIFNATGEASSQSSAGPGGGGGMKSGGGSYWKSSTPQQALSAKTAI